MKKIVFTLVLVLTAFIVSAQSDNANGTGSKQTRTTITKDKNYQIVKTTDTSGTVKKEVPTATRKHLQYGYLRNQKPAVADTSIINNQPDAIKAKKVVLSNQKNPAVK